jgi:formate dehydrogenase major subunit
MSQEDPVPRDLPVELVINGRPVRARPGQTVLEVARDQALDEIPTLCHDPRLEPFGSCFLCVVEVKGARGLVPACTTRIRDGMEVVTRSDRITRARRTALELLLSDHYADCVCPGQAACPAGVDVQGYLALVQLGRYTAAVDLIKERNPLPVVCGRVCVRKCELACRRREVDEAVGINAVKRFVSGRGSARPVAAPPTGHRVAVVGGGPAGLACAHFLALAGHHITIFEAMPKLGGMLRYGIPAYRLPRAELDAEIEEILDLGVEVELEKRLGVDFTIEELRGAHGFGAVFLALGAPRGRGLGVPGEEVEGVETALDRLRGLELDGSGPLEGRVVVVGGGNSALDAARTSVRCGAAEVTLLYRRSRTEMPAHPEEVDAAEHEGVRLELLAAPVEVLSDPATGRLRALRCQRMELGAPDASGRRSPVPIPGSEFELPCEHVFAAIGQSIDEDAFAHEPEPTRPRLKRGAVVAEPRTMSCGVPGVFAGGDLVTGPSVVIDAVAHGRRAAETIDRFLRTGEVSSDRPAFASRRDLHGPTPERLLEGVPRVARHKMPERPFDERRGDFAEVELGLAETDARAEAGRCLECGCRAQLDCDLRRYATEYGVAIERAIGQVRRHAVDDSHPLITIDPNKCILCSRCIRACADVLGLPVLGLVGRGFTTVVKPAMGRPLLESACISCGACVETCPTGALTAKTPQRTQSRFRSRSTPSACGFCSLACPLDLHVAVDSILFATAPVAPAAGAPRDLCARGRFGIGLIQASERVTRPLVLRDGRLEEATWDVALEEAARVLSEIRDNHGPGSVAVLAAPRLTLEESVLAARLARAGLRTPLIGSVGQLLRGGPRRDLDGLLGVTASTCTLADLRSAGTILVVGADPDVAHPVLGMELRRAARRGARVALVRSGRSELSREACAYFDPRRGTIGILLAGVLRLLAARGARPPGTEAALEAVLGALASAVPDEVAHVCGIPSVRIEELADLFSSTGPVVALYDLDEVGERSSEDLYLLGLAMLATGHLTPPGGGLLLPSADSNAVGALLAGLREDRLPGGSASDDALARRVAASWGVPPDALAREGALRRAVDEKRLAGALVLLEDPFEDPEGRRLLEPVETIVCMDSVLTRTARAARVVLPAASLAESGGTVVSFDGTLRALTEALPPQGGLSNHDVLARLSRALGHPIPKADPVGVRLELADLLGISAAALEQARESAGRWPGWPPRPVAVAPSHSPVLSSKPSARGRWITTTVDGVLHRRLPAAWGTVHGVVD